MCHGLLVMATICGDRIARGVERLPQACHVAMTENRPDPGDERLVLFVQLGRQVAYKRLCGG